MCGVRFGGGDGEKADIGSLCFSCISGQPRQTEREKDWSNWHRLESVLYLPGTHFWYYVVVCTDEIPCCPDTDKRCKVSHWILLQVSYCIEMYLLASAGE